MHETVPKLPADTLDSWKKTDRFSQSIYESTAFLPLYTFYCLSLGSPPQRFRVTQSAPLQIPKAESQTIFLFARTVLSQFFCSFPSWLKKPHREWESSYIRSTDKVTSIPNRATALDKLYLNLAC